MPLTRYEIRNEYSLANPDLYRAAAKDDPEGLLEGVAMAGLVGIVRQLGDLAEFAAEVFHDLHEEVLATAARGHELLIRVQQLEAELPFVEKLMLAESNYVNFAYTPGLEWHANIHNDQNHFTQGDLPRFIRNAYEDCRGPPRLFLLDKFDIAGAGACLKRYTDPSFFRMEWASSELMKAEKEQQDKKARRIKKKGRRQRNGEMREAFLAAHMQPRMRPAPLEVENTGSTSIHSHAPNSRHDAEQEGLHSGPQGTEQKLQYSRLLVPEENGANLKVSGDLRPPDIEHREASVHSLALSPCKEPKLDEVLTKPRNSDPVPSELVSEELEVASANHVEVQKKVLPLGMKISEDTIDFASETDNYVDALTTIDSEVETDSEIKTVFQTVEESTSNLKDEENTVHIKQVICGYQEDPRERDLVIEDDIVGNHIAPRVSDSSEGREPVHISSPEISPAKERESICSDDKHVSESNVSTPISESGSSTPPLETCTIKSGELLETESAEGIPETPETPEANEYYDRLQLETLTSEFHQLPEPAVPLGDGSQHVFPEHLGLISSRLGGDVVLPDREFCAEHAEKDSFGDTESEASEGLKESSPHSSANSSIQPMTWGIEPLRHPNITLESDDELDGMQVSSSSSTSSSALSSPRPSMLATTFFDNKPPSVLSPIKSSPESLSGVSPESGGSLAPHSPVLLMEAGVGSSMMSPHHVQMASHISSSSQQNSQDLLPEVKSNLPTFPIRDLAAPFQDQSLSGEEPEHFPPPPPLPPLEWRMTRRFGGTLSSSSKMSEPSPRPPIPQKPVWRPHESLQAANLPPLPQSIHTQYDELALSYKPFSTWHSGSKDHLVQSNGLERLETKEVSVPQTDPMIFEASSEEHTIFTGEILDLSARSKELVQPVRRGTFKAPVNASEASTSGLPSESAPFLQRNDSTDSFRSSTESPLDNKDTKVSTVQDDDGTVEDSSALPEGQESSIPSSGPCEISADNDPAKSSLNEKAIPPPPRLDLLSRDLRPPLPPPGLESDRIGRASSPPNVERKDSLIAAIAAHDKSTLRKAPEWSQSSRTPHADDREVLLEQIRTGSFSLRRTKIEKQEAPRPVTNINVAAILEKANAIRQAFAGSDDEDEDDDWSDG